MATADSHRQDYPPLDPEYVDPTHRSPPSAIHASLRPGMESPSPSTRQSAPLSPPTRNDEPDPRQSLQHVLASNDTQIRSPPAHVTPGHAKSSKRQKDMIWIHEGGSEPTEDETSVQNDSYTRAAEVNPSYTMTVAHTRRNANGTVGSVYSGNKIRHLKKEDGQPLWRRDIQFLFLRHVFEDQTAVFTMDSDGSTGHTFADIYIDAMARSSKTSKILKEKLLAERTQALNMAMVCLLVNVGRMNTTLNCQHAILYIAQTSLTGVSSFP
jgi:Ino eighty subunit 1